MATEAESDRWEITEILGRLPNSSNATLLARTAGAGLVVYKPERGERPLWDFAHGTLAAREVLTYEVAHAAAMSIVPKTVLIDGPFGRGSAQQFINENFDFDPVEMINSGNDALWPVAVLDLMINNADRKAGHVISEIDSDDLYCIDHGVSFHDEPKLRTVLWAFAGRDLPEDMVSGVARVEGELANGLHARIASLLSEAEADATTERVASLIASPIHPLPPTDRPPLPWPVW